MIDTSINRSYNGDGMKDTEGGKVKKYLSLDVGGSKYIIGLIDREGNILFQKKGFWRELSRDCVRDTILAESLSLLQETGEAPTACGITIPGLADPKKGLWVEAQFSGIRDFPICDEMGAALGIPCYCDNDGQAFSLAEMLFGACRDVRDFFYMNISTGIGGSIVSGGRLLSGARGSAGEIGHWVVVENGRPCKCGSRGCLEKYAAGPAIARNYEEAGGAPAEDGYPADAELIARRAREGEETALRVYREAGRLLGACVAKAVNLLNPSKVVLGGGVALAFDLFGPEMVRTVREQVYTTANPDVEILPTPLGYMAGLYGAAAIAVSREEHLFE